MSHADHEWTQERLAAHLAGGLAADERARVETHVAACSLCRADRDDMAGLNRRMDDLFAPVRPEPGFEDRVIQGLRTARGSHPRPFAARVVLAVAAVVLVGVLGFIFMEMEAGGLTQGKAPRHRASTTTLAPGEPDFRSNTAQPYGRGGWGLTNPAPTADELAMITVEKDLAKLGDAERNLGLAGLQDTRTLDMGLARGYRAEGGENERLAGRFAEGDKLSKAREMFERPGLSAAVQSPADAPPPAGSPAPQPDVATGKDVYFGLTDKSRSQEQLGQYFRFGQPLEEHGKKKGEAEEGRADAAPAKRPAADPKANKPDFTTTSLTVRTPTLNPVQEPPPIQRKIIRSGEVEFEIEVFDSAVATVTQIAAEEQGFVATVNSEKLPNGKVRGTVVVRVPPDNLDRLLLKIRALGELKSQRIGSQDVTKLYFDLESRLRAARTMEERLLKIIKEGKGEIKDLLAAEKELGEWRTKIESFEGEIRYYASLISLSTLTITLQEKEIRSPFGVTETEVVRMGIEVEDVEKTHRDALAAVAEAKGRVTKSEVKQHAAGQFTAEINFEVAPDAAGPLRDRLKQLGVVARLDVDRLTQTEGGSGRPGEVKVKRNDAQFYVSLYNLANIQPRVTVHVGVACLDAEKSYKEILARVEKAGGRVRSSNLNRQRSEQTNGVISFDIKAAEADAVLVDVRAQGEVTTLQETEVPESANVTRSKKGFVCTLLALGLVRPREATTLTVAAPDVAASYRAILEAARKAEARITKSHLNEQDRHNIQATLGFEVRRDKDAGVAEALKAAGAVYTRSSVRAPESENVVDSKLGYDVTLRTVESIPPRETFTMAIEVGDVDKAMAAAAADLKGRTIESRISRDRTGRVVGKLAVDVPLGKSAAAVDRMRGLGPIRVFDAARDTSVPENDLSTARFVMTITNAELIVPSDEGFGATIRSGLRASAKALSLALMFLIVGLCIVLPVGLVAWGGWRLYRRARPKPA